MNHKLNAVMGALPITAIYLEQRKQNRLIVSVPHIIPEFMLPFYSEIPHALPWLYTFNEEDYLGKLPLYYFQTPLLYEISRHKYQETPVYIIAHYLIPEPDKNYTYVPVKLYKSMTFSVPFKLRKTKLNNYTLIMKNAFQYKQLMFNAKRDFTQRLKYYLNKYYVSSSILFPILHGVPMGVNKGQDVTTIFGGGTMNESA